MEDNQPAYSRGFTFFACALIAMGIIAMTVSIIRVQQSVMAEERNRMVVIATSTAKSVDNYLHGCITGITLTHNSPSFKQAVALMRWEGSPGPLIEHLKTLSSEEHPAVADVCLLDADNRMLLCTSEEDDYHLLGDNPGHPGDGKLRAYRNRDGQLFLGIVTVVDADNYLLSLVDMERMYHNTASFATLGEKGYVMFKLSGGLILTHPSRRQIGTDVLSGRRAMYPDLDFSDLERLVAAQEQGKSGLEVYYSYWWAEDPPPRVKKISSYTPVHVQNDFLIISAVTDYSELLLPIQASSAVIISSAVLVSAGVIALLLQKRKVNQQRITRENESLRQLNRSLDEMARRREEMQHDQRLQMIGTLTGGIAHEFRNLLTPIMGYSGLLRESLPPDSPFREDIDEIYGAAVKAKEIIQQITALSRKNLEPVFKPLRLDLVVARALKMAATNKPAGFELSSDLDFDGLRVQGNKTQITQVVLNLCNNAFQARNNGGGHLWIEGRIEEAQGVKQAVLRFRDDGAGISSEIRDRIFDPFFTTKKVGEGTGLGLSVVQNIVDLHHGAVEVVSEPGKDTTFTLRFPTVLPEPTEDRDEILPARPLDDVPTVTLVEDDAQVLRVLCRGLEKSGFVVQAFEEPLEALKAMRENPSRLLVTDYNMPRMTGAELAMRVREFAKGTKILVLTGFADREILDYMQQEIIDGYQIKPVAISELVEKINGLFA